MTILCGSGVGGGSNVYANTLYIPPRPFFQAREWSGITDWEDELAPYYDQAVRMLGVVRVPYMDTDADRMLREIAAEMGRGRHLQQGAGRACISARRASRWTIPTSAAKGRGGRAASPAASA